MSLPDLSLEIEPLNATTADIANRIAQKIRATIPEEHLWIEGDTVVYFEARTGPSWMCRSARRMSEPVKFEDALLEFAQFHPFRAGLLCLSSGARVFVNLSDEPKFIIKSVEIPKDGEILSPAYTCEVLIQ